jgi:hypothetical protein
VAIANLWIKISESRAGKLSSDAQVVSYLVACLT